MVWNFLKSHGMPCYMIVLLKLHHLLGMASAEFRLGRVTHSCEGLCQSGDRGMVSRHHEPAENINENILILETITAYFLHGCTGNTGYWDLGRV